MAKATAGEVIKLHLGHEFGLNQSSPSADIGFILAARRAGNQQAIAAASQT